MNSGELKVDVPLAAVESDCEEDETGQTRQRRHRSGSARRSASTTGRGPAASSRTQSVAPPSGIDRNKQHTADPLDPNSVTGSLEDLVNSFDDKLTQCFKDYQEQVEKIAPVQVRTQEEIMNECQVWWTITGNFGNMAPIDWSKSTARANQIKSLNLNSSNSHQRQTQQKNSGGGRGGRSNNSGNIVGYDEDDDLEDEDDIVAADLDMHSLILTSNPQESSDPVKSADEVIKEIDEIIDAADEDEAAEAAEAAVTSGGDRGGGGGGGSVEAGDYATMQNTTHPASAGNYLPNMMPLSSRRVLSQALRGRNLEELSLNELTQILSDIELLVRELSEELVSDLGVRDELEYEKELKNTFISLLLSIQSRRRACGSDAMTSSRSSRSSRSSKETVGGAGAVAGATHQYKYLTTVIPYQPEKGTPTLQGLQVLVKILKAINEDSPAVPALLTDYILKVLCPS